MRSVMIAPLRADLSLLLATFRVRVPVAVRLAEPRDLVPSLAAAVTLAPVGVRTLKRSVPDLRRVLSATVLGTVAEVSASFGATGVGVAVGVGVAATAGATRNSARAGSGSA